jgi:predicted ABC-type ATPase
MLIVAGPNGSGKSTFVASSQGRALLDDLGLAAADVLNADDRAKSIAAGGPVTPAINLQAAIETDAEVDRCIERGSSFGVETVLSSSKYLAPATVAVDADFLLVMIYICVRDAQTNLDRVRTRVDDGGHDVPHEKIRERREKSIVMMKSFIPKVDALYVFDNTELERGAQLIAVKYSRDADVTILRPGIIPEIDAVLSSSHNKRPERKPPGG